MFWTISSFPDCQWHIFLSHCREDRAPLVHPLDERLRVAGVLSWLDRDDYAYGRDSRTALRDGILRCRHTVMLITKTTLTQSRGWAVQELCWAELLQANLVIPGGTLQNVILPLFFVDPTHPDLAPSVWNLLLDRGRFYGENDGDQVEWAASQVLEFLRREEKQTQDLAVLSKRDPAFRAGLKDRVPGLFQRVTSSNPPLPSV